MDSPSLEVVQADRLHRLQLGSSGSGVTTWALPRCPSQTWVPGGIVLTIWLIPEAARHIRLG